jgi:nitroreductase
MMLNRFLTISILLSGSTILAQTKFQRTPGNAGVDKLFFERWSPRAMSGEQISEVELKSLFEAARWAPSSYNEQPWRFIYARKGTAHWNRLFNLLVPFNQDWVKNGSVLVVMISKNSSFQGGLNRTHSFDAGAAWQNLALQGHLKGFVVHGMAGFDYDKARTELRIPEDYTIEAMCVIGKQGDPSKLPDHLKEMEKPSDRRKIEESIAEGYFNF